MKTLILTLFAMNSYNIDSVSFERDIKPVFKNYCVECHKGITSYEGAYSKRFKIYDKVVKKKKMPPNFRLKLSEYETVLVKKWIEQGAKK